MSSLNDLIKLSKYPEWSYKFVFRSVFVFVFILTTLFITYEFIQKDLEHKYSIMPTNEIIEYDSELLNIEDLDGYQETIRLKSSILSDRLDTQIVSYITVNSTIYGTNAIDGIIRGYSIDFTNDIQSYVNLHYHQSININYFSENRLGLVISKQLFYELYPIDDQQFNFMVTTDSFGFNFSTVQIVGYFETKAYKSILFDQYNDEAAVLNWTIFAPLETMTYLNQTLSIYNNVYPNNVYRLSRSVVPGDTGVINSILNQISYKLQNTNAVFELFSPLIELMLSTIIFLIITISSINILILVIRFEDLWKIIYIQNIFFRSKNRIIGDVFISNILINVKSLIYAFIPMFSIKLLILVFTGYWIDIYIVFSLYICVLLSINTVLLMYYMFRLSRLSKRIY